MPPRARPPASSLLIDRRSGMGTADAPDTRPAADAPEAEGRQYGLALDQAELARYTLMADQARTSEADLWQRAGITAGAHVADVGCGPGALLPALGQAVQPSGRVTAIDGDPRAVAEARALVSAARLGNVSVRAGLADQTGLEPESCDVVMLRHVLAHNGGREQAIVAHLAALLRPGGCLYLLDSDGTAVRTVPEDADLEDLARRYQEYHVARGNDVRAGLRLGERLLHAGLVMVEFRGTYLIRPLPPGIRPPAWAAREAMVAAGVATDGDVIRWAEAFDRIDATASRPTQFVPMFAALGRRPG
jgi:SAM-dependent methyltransferase